MDLWCWPRLSRIDVQLLDPIYWPCRPTFKYYLTEDIHCIAAHACVRRWYVLDCVLDVQLGLELLSVHEDWKSVKMIILEKTLMPVLDSWLSSTSHTTDDAVYKEHIVGLVGKIFAVIFQLNGSCIRF
jgi:hypothetical protein